MSPLHVVMAAGGTAGHVAPAINTARALCEIAPETQVSIIGTGKDLERQLASAAGYPLVEIPAVAMPRTLSLHALRVPTDLARAVRAARRYLRDSRADVVVGFGGYAAAPAYVAARSLGIPYIVHEANARAGWANRLGARFTPYVGSVHATGLPHERHVGMPLAKVFEQPPDRDARLRARELLGIPPEAQVIVAFGGSQGARRINEAITELVEKRPEWWIVHAHGHGHEPHVQSENYLPRPFIADMYAAYAAANLVVARAGAMTVAEIAAVGTPAVLVPLPHGNGEQRENALPLAQAGGVELVDDHELSADFLERKISGLFADPPRLARMKDALIARSEPSAAHGLAQWIVQVVPGNGDSR